MASINRIEIKALKEFKGHEGEPVFQGNIYYKGKKLGFWSNDSWGGPDSYDFDTSVLSSEVERVKRSDFVEDKYRGIYDLDILVEDILELISDEKTYKKGVKNGFKTMVLVSDGYHVDGFYSKRGKDNCKETKAYADLMKRCDKNMLKNKERKVKMYGGLDDFKLNF